MGSDSHGGVTLENTDEDPTSLVEVLKILNVPGESGGENEHGKES